MKNLLTTITQTDSSSAATVLRIPVGIVFAAHGAQKLFGWFGGYGLEGTGQFMSSMGLEPGVLMAALAGSAEFFGGIALVAGALTRPAAALTAFTMLIAMFAVHWSQGFFMSNNGIEYSLTLLAASIALMVSGGGKYSVDRSLSKTGTGFAPQTA